MSSCLEGGSLRATVGAVKPRTDAAPAADNENNTHTPRAPDQQHTQSLALLLCFPSLRYPPPPGVNANRQQLNCWQEASQAAWLPGSCRTALRAGWQWWGGCGEGGGRVEEWDAFAWLHAVSTSCLRAGNWEQFLLMLLQGSTQCWRHFAVCLSSCNKMASGMLFPLTTTTTMMLKMIMMMVMMLLTEC